MIIEIYPNKIESDKKAWLNLLHDQGIKADKAISNTYAIYESSKMIATASTYKNIIKCVAISDDYKGGQVFNEIISHTINQIYSKNYDGIFVYTKPEHTIAFKSLGFRLLAQVDDKLSFLEKSSRGIDHYLASLKTQTPATDPDTTAAIVMNANPMTLGHLHLITEARKNSEALHLFVVSEDESAFPTKIRKEIVTKATAHLNHVYIHDTAHYIVSSATFPSYFLKDSDEVTLVQAKLDALIFKNYIAKALNIGHRFVGEEPFSPQTHLYNHAMKEVFATDPSISLHVIKRLSIVDGIISATKVRFLLEQGKIDEVRKFVPDQTYDFLLSDEGRRIIEKIDV